MLLNILWRQCHCGIMKNLPHAFLLNFDLAQLRLSILFLSQYFALPTLDFLLRNEILLSEGTFAYCFLLRWNKSWHFAVITMIFLLGKPTNIQSLRNLFCASNLIQIHLWYYRLTWLPMERNNILRNNCVFSRALWLQNNMYYCPNMHIPICKSILRLLFEFLR